MHPAVGHGGVLAARAAADHGVVEGGVGGGEADRVAARLEADGSAEGGVPAEPEGVRAGAAREDALASTAGEPLPAGATAQHVQPGPPEPRSERVVASATAQDTVAALAPRRVVALAAPDGLVAPAAGRWPSPRSPTADPSTFSIRWSLSPRASPRRPSRGQIDLHGGEGARVADTGAPYS